MISHINQGEFDYEWTLATLRLSNRAKFIKNKPNVSVCSDISSVSDFNDQYQILEENKNLNDQNLEINSDDEMKIGWAQDSKEVFNSHREMWELTIIKGKGKNKFETTRKVEKDMKNITNSPKENTKFDQKFQNFSVEEGNKEIKLNFQLSDKNISKNLEENLASEN